MKAAKKIFEIMKKSGCRELIFHLDPNTNMKAILAIDSVSKTRDKNGKLVNVSTSGGIRIAHDEEDDALEDAMKLSRGMTRKANVLEIDEGGAKAVVLKQEKTPKLLQAMGDFVQIHKGLFKTAVDFGLIEEDGEIIATRTDFIDSLSPKSEIRPGLGDTGANTAEGIMHGFDIICKRILKKPFENCSIAIQGLGSVGFSLAERLRKIGCKVIAADVNEQNCKNAQKIGVEIVKPEEIFGQEVDIFAPCALGGILNKETILRLRCKVVAGGGNNPLKNEIEGEKQLLQRGIKFIPEFVLNSAGFLQALVEREGGTIEEAREKSKIVAKRIDEIIDFSEKNNCDLLQSSLKLFGGSQR